jgi:hypothetical protein
MTEPPSAAADQVTTAEAFPRVADTAVGTSGFVIGVTAEEGIDGVELPKLFTAMTVKVMTVPFVSPVRLAVRTFPTVIADPTDGVTM